MHNNYLSLAMLLALLAGLASACGDDDDPGCRGLDSDHDGLVYKCDEQPLDSGLTEPPPTPPKDAGSGAEQDAGNDDENDAGQD